MADSLVECHAGRHYPERPMAFRWEGRRVEVEEVEQQWRAQGAAYSSPVLYHYLVRTAEGRFHLVYDSDNDVWQIKRSAVSGQQSAARDLGPRPETEKS